MVTHPDPADEQLALRTCQGDTDAFAALYDRHFGGVYDLVYRMVRDSDAAADIAQNTFIRAWENLQRRKVTGNVRAWLLTIARNTAINEIRRKKRWRAIVSTESDSAEAPAFEAVDTSRLSNPEAVVDDQELVDLVWTSAAALGPKDYSLLDLHLRKDLSAGEMAAGLGLSSARVHVMLSRLKDALEESVSVALMARRGREDCSQLSEILDARGGELSRDTRLEVRRHLKECDLCAASRKRFVAPAEIFSGLALIPVSHATTADIWSRVSPFLVPGAGALGLLAGARETVGHWWGEAGVGVKAAAVVALAAVVAVPVGVSLLLASTGGAEDSGAPTQPAAEARADAPGDGPSPTSASEDPSATLSPTPVAAAAAAASPAPGETAAPGQPAPAPGETAAPAPVPGATAAPVPTVAPAPPPATPAPQPNPPPADQADIAVVSVDVTAGSSPSAGIQFYVSANALLRNHGGAPSALVDTLFSFTAPGDCSFSPAAPVTVQDKTVAAGADVSITRTWSVTCANSGDHTFGANAAVTIDPSQALTDPNPANNAGSGSLGVSVLP